MEGECKSSKPLASDEQRALCRKIMDQVEKRREMMRGGAPAASAALVECSDVQMTNSVEIETEDDDTSSIWF